jgi:NAD(P)-dependent dehydrogenase (short-subunit alcohol dehydrogenase family)
MHKLIGKNAVVTGGTSGIGLATAQLFHEQGARVLVTGRSEANLASARKALPDDVQLLRSDAADRAAIDELAKELERRFDGIDVLFLNAGTARVAPLSLVTDELFEQLFAVNVKGPLFAIQRLRPLLRPQASVVVNTSVAGHWHLPGTSVYAASKAALRALTRTLAAELAPHVRVNALCPGLVETPIFEKIGLPADALAVLGQQLVGMTAAARPGRADEVARAALFLASSDSSYVVGEELVVDGGMMMR